MIHDFKLTIINFIIIAFAFTNAEIILRLTALVFTIVYTGYKIVEIHQNLKNKKNGSNIDRQNQDTPSKD